MNNIEMARHLYEKARRDQFANIDQCDGISVQLVCGTDGNWLFKMFGDTRRDVIPQAVRERWISLLNIPADAKLHSYWDGAMLMYVWPQAKG